MGVAGLWELLRPASKTRSLTELAIQEGFEANPDEYGKEGENPVLRTLFFRCATLMRTTFLPIFVFDGPKRPDVKRGKRINKTGHKLIPGMKQIVEAFGFEWRMAPGEAEAELAYLNRIGVIDGVLSDDVDNFLFGAMTVVRNSSATLSGNRSNPAVNSAGKEDKNHTYVYKLQDIKNHPDVKLTRGGMILIGLMSGGDYHSAGVPRCGKVTAHGLAKCGFGDSLYDAAVNLDRDDLTEFIFYWREELQQELRTNSKGHIGRKQVALANSFPTDFPDIDILLSYVKPITSESMGRESNNTKLTWSKEPDLGKLAATCEFYFEWGYKEAIIKRFRTVMWHSIVLRVLRRATLDLDSKRTGQRGPPSTPRKQKEGILIGTPSKMIAQHFSALGLATPTRTYISGSESEDEDEERLILKIHSSRTHTSTNGMLEYRLEIAPKQLVRLAEAGVKGTRVPEGPDEWASEEDDDDEDTKKKSKVPIDPETHLRLWMPACMVKLVEPDLVQEHEEREDQKRQMKLKKGTKKTTAASKPADKTKKKTAKQANPAPVDIADDVFSSPIQPKPTNNVRPPTKRRPALESEGSSDPEVSSDPDLPASLSNRLKTPKFGEVLELSSDEEPPTTKLTGTAISRGADTLPKSIASIDTVKSTNGLKGFFPVTKSSNKVNFKPSTSNASKIAKGQLPNSGTNKSSDLQIAGPSKLGKGQKPKFPSHYESDDSFGEYDPAIWANMNATGFSISSPSKRKNKEKASYASSDSDSFHRVKKSPRKKMTQTPEAHRRPVSPSPARLRPPVYRKICDEVIDIPTDSESDDGLPQTILPLSKTQKDLPPLLKSRAIKASASTTGVSSSSNKPTHKKPPPRPINVSDIIDLT